MVPEPRRLGIQDHVSILPSLLWLAVEEALQIS